MKTSSILDAYQTWLTHREYSPATIQKYTKALARFFADTGAGDAPDRETVAAWRDSLVRQGYTPSTVNTMLAAVNGFFAFLGWWGLAVKLLKIQKSPFCDEGKELTRAEYARLVRAAERRENERLSLVIQTICATGIRVSELRFITVETVQAGRRSATRASGGSCSCPTSCGGCCRNISGRKKRPPGRCSPPRRASRWTNRTPGGT